jgi:glycosyltransferase involved in cell wall biosynthesis
MNVVARLPGPRRCLEWALPRAERVVAVSKPLREAAIAFGVTPDRVDIVPNGIDRALFRPRDRGDARRTRTAPERFSRPLRGISAREPRISSVRSPPWQDAGTFRSSCSETARKPSAASSQRSSLSRSGSSVRGPPSTVLAGGVRRAGAAELERRYAQRRARGSRLRAPSRRDACRWDPGRRQLGHPRYSRAAPGSDRADERARNGGVHAVRSHHRLERSTPGLAGSAHRLHDSLLAALEAARASSIDGTSHLAAGDRGTPRTGRAWHHHRWAPRSGVSSAILPASMVVWRGPALHVQVGRGRAWRSFDDGRRL